MHKNDITHSNINSSSSDQTPLISSKLVKFTESTSSKKSKSKSNKTSRPLVTRKVEINMAPVMDQSSTIWTANRYSLEQGPKQTEGRDSTEFGADMPELETDLTVQPVVRRLGPKNGWCFWLFLALVCVMLLMGAVLLAMTTIDKVHDKNQRLFGRR